MKVFCKKCNKWINFSDTNNEENCVSFKDLVKYSNNEFSYFCICGMILTFEYSLNRIYRIEKIIVIDSEFINIINLDNEKITVDVKRPINLYNEKTEKWDKCDILNVYSISYRYFEERIFGKVQNNLYFTVVKNKKQGSFKINPFLELLKQ